MVLELSKLILFYRINPKRINFISVPKSQLLFYKIIKKIKSPRKNKKKVQRTSQPFTLIKNKI